MKISRSNKCDGFTLSFDDLLELSYADGDYTLWESDNGEVYVRHYYHVSSTDGKLGTAILVCVSDSNVNIVHHSNYRLSLRNCKFRKYSGHLGLTND